MERKCDVCGILLCGRQKRFCGRNCKNADTNCRLQNYAAQSVRGLSRKIKLVSAAGGQCSICGYRKNLAALTWHHRIPALKCFELDLRNLSNRSELKIALEAAKCDLLCANCHAEEHERLDLIQDEQA